MLPSFVHILPSSLRSPLPRKPSASSSDGRTFSTRAFPITSTRSAFIGLRLARVTGAEPDHFDHVTGIFANSEDGNEKRGWWGFGKPAQEKPTVEDERDGSVQIVVDSRPSDEEPNKETESKNQSHENTHSETSTESANTGLMAGLIGFVTMFVTKLIERRKAAEDEAKRKDQLVVSVENLKDATPKEDLWTQVLNVIVPKRNKPNTTPSSTQTPTNLNVTPKTQSEEEEKQEPLSPMQKLRKLRDSYLASRQSESTKETEALDPPSVRTEKNSDETSAKQTDVESKPILISQFLPWLSKSDDTSRSSDSDSSARMKNSDANLSDSKKTTRITVVNETQSVGESDSKPESKSAKKSESKNKSSDKSAKQQAVTVSMEVATIPQKDIATIRLIFGSETFFATETVSHPGGLIFRGNLRGEPKATLAKLEKRLHDKLGDKYTLCLAEGDDDLRPVVVVVPTARDKKPSSPRQRVLALTIGALTLMTCFARGGYANLNSAVIRDNYGLPLNPSIIDGIFLASPVTAMAISIALVLIITQIVQRIVARRRRTRMGLPYLIPSYQLGCFGSVVQIASPTPSRAALFDIAFAGALTLLVVSLGLLIIGLKLSTTFTTVIPVSMSMVSSSMVIGALTTFIPNGDILVDYGRSWIGLHPLAVIGANCLTIAALNLLPIRQLDGGRIVFAIYGRKTAVIASRVTTFFLLLASAKVPYYFVFLAAISFGPWSLDRPAKNELTEPDGFRAILGYILLLAMVGILLPSPPSKFFGTL